MVEEQRPSRWRVRLSKILLPLHPAVCYTSGRGGIGNFHPDASPPPLEEQAQEIPWPRGRSREPRRGSQSTGRGGYGNITSTPRNREWSYSTQEQEILRAHAEARRVAIPIGRGGYGNIAHARALAAEAGTRSQSVDPVAAPTSMSFSLPLPMSRYHPPRRGKVFQLNGLDESAFFVPATASGGRCN
ncbi:hypothetical protein B0H12DRAFT_743058 [Mycena haematopus]|nr:hypothetical protein B0H12DRAFT_743058 [Mycena haematopus]